MNFESIKQDFIFWLEKNGKTAEKEITSTNSDMSIFLYNTEFKKYLVQEVGADISIFSKSINEIMSMDIVNGKLVDKNEETGDSFVKNDDEEYSGDSLIADSLNAIFENEDFAMYLDTDTNGELGEEEINNFLTGIANPDDGQISFDSIAGAVQAMNDGTFSNKENESSETELLLKGIYSNEKAINTLDLNGDGELSPEEKTKFEEYIKGFDSNAEDLSKEDIQTAFGQILRNEFSYENANEEQIPEELPNQEELTAPEASTAPQSGGSSPISGGGAPISGGGYAAPSGGNTLQLEQTSGLESKSLEELEQVKNTRQGNVSKARDNINAIYSGENQAVKTAQENYEKAKEAYDEAVKNDDKISDELKQKRNENLEAIETKQGEIDDVNTQINNKEAEISDAENTLAADESNLSALKSALAALPASSDDSGVQAQIEAQRSELERQIKELETTKIPNDKDKIEQLNSDLDDLKEQLETKQGELDKLEQERQNIENGYIDENGNKVEGILDNCSPETKQALEAFNEAKETVASVKETELKSAKETLTLAETALDEVNTVINNKKAEETKNDHRVSDSKYDGQEFLDTINNLGGNATTFYSRLCKEMGMNEKEVADYLTELSNSEQWANGCVSPIMLFAQICNESGCYADAVGDNGAALGLGQFHECAVDEVNNQFGTNYTYADRANPKKALEMMSLLLKYDYNSSGSTVGMYTKYASGNTKNLNIGETYISHLKAKIGLT